MTTKRSYEEEKQVPRELFNGVRDERKVRREKTSILSGPSSEKSQTDSPWGWTTGVRYRRSVLFRGVSRKVGEEGRRHVVPQE